MSPAVTLFVGDNALLIDDAIDKWIDPSLFTERREGQSFEWGELQSIVQSSLLFEDTLQLIITQPFFLKNTPSDSEMAQLEQFIEACRHSPHRILMIHKGLIDKRKKVTKFLQKNTDFTEFLAFSPFDTGPFTQWLNAYARHLNKQLSPQATRWLVEWGSGDPFHVKSLLQTTAVYVGNRPNIEHTDLQEVAVSAGPSHVITLLEFIRKKDSRHIQNLLYQAIKVDHEDPIGLLGFITNTLRTLLMVVFCCKEGLSDEAIGTLMGKSPYYIKHLKSDIQAHYRMQELVDMYTYIADVDVGIKSGEQSPDSALLQVGFLFKERIVSA